MPKELVICEKPSVARDVAAALGARKADGCYESDRFVIAWAYGHLVAEAAPDAYDERYKQWRYEDLPIIPEHTKLVARDDRSRTQLRALANLIGRDDVTGLVNACDAGREGELIFKLIRDIIPAARPLPVRRAWFSSMTNEAITAAFAALRPDTDMAGLEAAARARANADWLIGLNATRAATTKAGGPGNIVSLGRVQTPTLALIANRDAEIASFVPEDYWVVDATFAAPAGTWTGRWFGPDGTRFGAAELADAIVAAVRAAGTGQVSEVTETPRSEPPPLLFDLTSLQREANKAFGFTAKRTLAAAQSLYETHKLLTYPRTDSKYLTTDMVATLPALVARLAHVNHPADPALAATLGTVAAGLAGQALDTKRIVNDAKVADHHAIIVTDTPQDLAELSDDEVAIWELVARRFLGAFLPAARYLSTIVITDVTAPGGPHRFRSTGRVMLDAGWRILDRATPPGADDDGSDDNDEEPTGELPPLSEGTRADVTACDALAKQTKPPAHFNEASLLGAMETAGKLVDDEDAAAAMRDSGLGTPATRAAIIERLIAVGYVERKGRKLLATAKGAAIIAMLGDHVLASPALTGDWERRLAEMERDVASADAFNRDIRTLTGDVVVSLAGLDPKVMAAARSVAACPRCPGHIIEGRKAWGCDSWQSRENPGCGFLIWKTRGKSRTTTKQLMDAIAANRSDSDPPPEIADCPRCAGKIIEGTRAWGCNSWRSREDTGCGFIIWKTRGKAKVTDAERDAQIAANRSDSDPAPEVGPCPTPGCAGTIRDRAKAYGCDSWRSKDDPGCGFVIWKSSGGVDIDLDTARRMVTEGRSNAGSDRDALCPCPTGGCTGTLREQRSKKGWSCDSWRSKKDPGCGTVIWRTRKDGTVLSADDARAEAAARAAGPAT